MMRRNHPNHDAFADWLDAGRTERPGSGASADADIDLHEAQDGAAHINALNRRFERHALAVAPGRTPLESILAAASVPPPTSGMPNRSHPSPWKESCVDGQSAQPISSVPFERVGIGRTLTRIISVAAIVAILDAASASVWMNRGQLGIGGGGDEPERLSYGSFMLPDGQEVEIAYDVPDAEDCTVEPLTVDEVMEKLSEPHQEEFVAAYATAQAMYLAGTPLPDPVEPVPTLPRETHAEIAAAQREWLACSLFGTPLQRWALETNRRVQVEIQQLYFPAIDLERVRQDLEDLAAGKENRLSGPTLTDGSLLPMVPTYTEGFYNQLWMEGQADISIVWVRPDGTALVAMGWTLEDLEPYDSATSLEQRLPNAWTFLQNPETGQWLLEDMTLAMG